VRIGEEVSVTVVSVNGNQVRLGIAAPRSVAVHRKEIFKKLGHDSLPPPAMPPETPAPVVTKVVKIVIKKAGRRVGT
jgi:carbon storage regulator